MNNTVYVLTGKAQSGKDTVAVMIESVLKELGGQTSMKLAYADYLKSICMRNFGFKDKESGRVVLQNIGDLVRSENDYFLINIVWDTIVLLHKHYDCFIVTDARFENEMKPYPFRLNYNIVNVYIKGRTDNELPDNLKKHESEEIANNPNLEMFNYVIDNTGSLEDTYKNVIEMITDVLCFSTKSKKELFDEITDDKSSR